MKLLVHIYDGKMDAISKMAIARYCSKTKNGQAILSLKAPSKPASWEQHKYCRGVVIPLIADYMGHEEHEYELVYQWVKHEVWRKYYPNKVPPSFASDQANTVEFEDFLAKIRQWAAEVLHVDIPAPNEPICQVFFGD